MFKSNKRNKNLLIGLSAILFLGITFIGLIPNTTRASAERTYFSDELYTQSDQLLKANGEENQEKNIADFAEEVKAAPDNTLFPELAEVIPLQYLESAEENAVFSYNGAEYGFYMVKEGNYFDLLLIDFVFAGGSVSDIEYKIRIKPILQQSFERSVDESGNFVWKKCYTTDRNKYYVANPRFITKLQNENALNYGDEGYSKQLDDGLIILQSRVNYGILD